MSLKNKIKGIKEIWAFDNRLWLAATKMFFPKETLHTYRYRGLEILVDHAAGDANGARAVLATPMYSRFLSEMDLANPLNVLDLGANTGGFPLLLASRGLALRKVVSVELNPRTYTRLQFNLNRNLNCEVIALNTALCGQNKTISVKLGIGSVADNIYSHAAPFDADVFEIQGLTIDSYCEKFFNDEIIDICKIDVEGAEFEVFLQPSHQSLRRCRYLIMEIHESSNRQADEIYPAIEKLGFVRQNIYGAEDQAVHFFVNSAFGNRT